MTPMNAKATTNRFASRTHNSVRPPLISFWILCPGPWILLALLLLSSAALAADPLLDSWFTSNSGRYARVYTNATAQTNRSAATSWSNGSQNQNLPAYSGVQEIYSSSNWLYIRSTGLG